WGRGRRSGDGRLLPPSLSSVSRQGGPEDARPEMELRPTAGRGERRCGVRARRVEDGPSARGRGEGPSRSLVVLAGSCGSGGAPRSRGTRRLEADPARRDAEAGDEGSSGRRAATPAGGDGRALGSAAR